MPEEIGRILEMEIARAIRTAVGNGMVGVGNLLETWVKGMDIGAKGDMARVHKGVAATMRTAIKGAYESNVEGQKTVPSYSRSNRLSGQLSRLVKRRDLVSGDHEGIRFLDEATMKKEAAHWARMNFGAGAAAGPDAPDVEIRLFDEAVLTVGFPFTASPPFNLPKGFFVNGGRNTVPNAEFRGQGTGGPFYPNARSPYTPRVTAGIKGRHFLQAGLDAAARELPMAYEDMIAEWAQRRGGKGRLFRSSG